MRNTIDDIRSEIDALRRNGTYKEMPILDGPMGPTVKLADGREVDCEHATETDKQGTILCSIGKFKLS